jgi:putative sterol carrier protein
MTTDFANLPADITPGALFSALAEALEDEPAPAGAAPDKLLLHVNGDAGGTWAMGFIGGRLAIDPGTADSPPLQVSISTDDLRAFVAGEVRDAIKAKAGPKASAVDPKKLSKLFGITHKTEQVKAYSGDLQMVVENGAKSHKLTLTFGGGAPNPGAPTTTISISLDDFLALLGGELNAQAAFFAGKIRLDGDMNLAMGMMALTMG